MSDRYPFDANGNLLPGLQVVNGQVVAASGEVVDAALTPVMEEPVVGPPVVETEPAVEEHSETETSL